MFCFSCFCCFGALFCFSPINSISFCKSGFICYASQYYYISPIHDNFYVVNYFLYKCAFLCIFQSLLLSWLHNKLLFSLYYFTCCNCFVIYKIKVGLVYSFHHCQNLSEWAAVPLITIALFCFVLVIIALVILL